MCARLIRMLPTRTSRQYRARCTCIRGRTCTRARISTDGLTLDHTGGTRRLSATNISSIAAGTVANGQHIAAQDKTGGPQGPPGCFLEWSRLVNKRLRVICNPHTNPPKRSLGRGTRNEHGSTEACSRPSRARLGTQPAPGTLLPSQQDGGESPCEIQARREKEGASQAGPRWAPALRVGHHHRPERIRESIGPQGI